MLQLASPTLGPARKRWVAEGSLDTFIQVSRDGGTGLLVHMLVGQLQWALFELSSKGHRL